MEEIKNLMRSWCYLYLLPDEALKHLDELFDKYFERFWATATVSNLALRKDSERVLQYEKEKLGIEIGRELAKRAELNRDDHLFQHKYDLELWVYFKNGRKKRGTP